MIQSGINIIQALSVVNFHPTEVPFCFLFSSLLELQTTRSMQLKGPRSLVMIEKGQWKMKIHV